VEKALSFASFVSAAAWISLVVVVSGAVQGVPGGMHIHRRCQRK